MAFLLLALIVYLPTADYDQRQNFDIVAVVVPVWSLVERGSLDVQPYQDLAPWFFESGDRWVSNRWPGTMLFALPAYVAVSPWTAADEPPPLWPATLVAVLTAACAVATLFALFLREHGPSVAWGAGLVIALGTGMWTVAAESLWTHAPAVLLSGLALHSLRADRQWRAGVWFGVLGLVRPHLLSVAAITGYILARERRDPRVLVRIGLPSAVGLLLFLVYAGRLTGGGLLGFLPYAFETPTGWARLTNMAGLLVSPRVGLLVYTPAIACCCPQLAQAWRQAPAWERAALFGGALYLVIQVQSNYFFGGHSFYGYRLPLEGLTFAAPLLVRSGVLFVRRSQKRAVIYASLAAWTVWIHAVGAVFYRAQGGMTQDPWRVFGPVDALAGQSGLVIALVILFGLVLGSVVLRTLRTLSGHPSLTRPESR